MEERIEKWDILKFGLIFLVVLGHICDQYVKQSAAVRAIWLFIYSFHMPLFFFVSGLFSKRKINEKQYVRIFSYFALYIVSQAFLLLSKMVFANGFGVELLNTKDAPWFIFVLFMYYIITIALRHFDGKYVLLGSIVLACMAGYDNSISDMFQMSRLIVFYPFFYLGYYLDEGRVRQVSSAKWVRSISIILLMAVFVYICFNIQSVYWVRALLTGRNPFSKLEGIRYPLGGLLRFFYYTISAFIGAMVIAVIPEHIGKGLIAQLGSRSIQVYVLHRPLIILFCARLHIENWFAQIWPEHYHLLIVPLAFVITLFCSWKVFEKPIRILIMPSLKEQLPN